MIESARFTNINGMYVDFNTDDIPFNRFRTEVDLRFTDKDKSQEHGIHPGETYLGKRLFHCEGDLFADSSAQYIERRLAMVGALMPRPQFGRKVVGTLDLLFTGMSEHLTCECTLDGYPELPLDGASPARSGYQVNFKSYDPRLYGAWQTLDIAYSAGWQNLGGRGYDKTYNKTYSAALGTQGDAIISNSGNYDTYPIITFYGPVTDPTATLSTSTGEIFIFKLNGLVLANVSDWVTIDFKKHTVTRYNGANLYNYAEGSDWWLLEPSPIVNTVRYSATILAVPSHMSIQWRNAFMF